MSEAGRASALELTFRWPVLFTGLKVSAVVGSVLNLINQGDAIAAGGPIDWMKLGLTYIVPFCVTLYGAYSAHRSALQGEPA